MGKKSLKKGDKKGEKGKKGHSHFFAKMWLPPVLLIVVTLLFFLPCLHNGFTFWDDPDIVTNNMTIRHSGWPAIREIFQRPVLKTYVPLTTLTYWIEYHLFGLNPFVFHLDNLLLHLANVVLVFLLALKMNFSRPVSFIAALLFGIHPMHVEPVAWVTSRKDVLYTFFYLLVMLSYISYIQTKSWPAYIAGVGFGLLSILAKPMALSLIFILVLLDWFYKRRWSLSLVWEKIPFLLYLVPIAWLTYRFHARVPGTTLDANFMTWVWCFTFYLKKFLWPAVYLPLYLMPGDFHHPEFDLALAVSIIVILLLVYFHKNRIWLFAFGFYFLSVFFLFRFDTLKDVQAVADRYMYLPSVGFCILAGYLVSKLLQFCSRQQKRWHLRNGIYFLLALTSTFLGIGTFKQCRLWGDERALWTRTISFYPSSVTYQKLGDYFYLQEMNAEAMTHYLKSMEFDPSNYEVLLNLATIYADRLDYANAFKAANRVIELAPEYPIAYVNRAVMFGQIHRLDAALADLSKAIELDPYNDTAYNNRGLVYSNLGWDELALGDFNRSVEINPAHASTFFNRGLNFMRMGKWERAIADFETVLKITPDFVPARAYLQKARSQLSLEQQNQIQESLVQ